MNYKDSAHHSRSIRRDGAKPTSDDRAKRRRRRKGSSGRIQGQAHPAPGSPFEIWLAFIEWLSKSWAFLAGAAFMISMFYVMEFKRSYGVSVGLVSSSSIGALPLVFGFVFIATAVLCLFLLGPSVVMWMPAGPGGRRLVDGHRPTAGKGCRNPFMSTDLGSNWMASQVAGVGTILGALSYTDTDSCWGQCTSIFLVMLGAAIAVLGLQGARRRAGISRWGTCIVIVLALVGLVIQCLSASMVFKFASTFAAHNPSVPNFFRPMFGFALATLVVVGQFLVTEAAKDGLRLDVMQRAVFICLAATAFPLVSPDFAAEAPARLLQERGPDGSTCARLVGSSEAVAADWEGIRAEGSTLVSVDLVYIAQLDGYQVKAKRDGPTTTVPTKQVRRLDACTGADIRSSDVQGHHA